MADHCCQAKGAELEKLALRADQRRVLVVVLVINAAMFFAEFGAGLVAGSAALMADATDMLGDRRSYSAEPLCVRAERSVEGGRRGVQGALHPACSGSEFSSTSRSRSRAGCRPAPA